MRRLFLSTLLIALVIGGIVSVCNIQVNPAKAATPTPTSTPEVTVSLSESASALNYGNTINFTVSADGGTKPYTFKWYVDGRWAETSVSLHFSIDTLAVGSHFVYVQVNDTNDNSATTNTVSFEVLPVSSPSSSSPSPSIPEFPSFIVVPILMATLLAGVIIYKRKHNIAKIPKV